ncbi:MAG: helix-turn-helix transcriptional regulator [Eubacteriales bacterium]
MNNEIYSIGSKISFYRKLYSMTQDSLADVLGLSTQAISKWEQHLSCPDILLLPKIADIFNISIDELFEKTVEKEVIYNYNPDLPWQDDEKLRVVLFNGKKIVNHKIYECKEGKDVFLFDFHGSPYDMKGTCSIKCDKENRLAKFDLSKEKCGS